MQIYSNLFKFIQTLTFVRKFVLNSWLVLILLFFTNITGYSQEYPFYIDKTSAFTHPIFLNLPYIDETDDYYWGLFCEDSPWGPLPFYDAVVKFRKYDKNGNLLLTKVFDGPIADGTPDVHKIGDNYRVVLRAYDYDLGGFIYYSELYDGDFNLLEHTELPVYMGDWTFGLSTFLFGAWKTIGRETGHFYPFRYSAKNAVSMLVLYDENGFFKELKDIREKNFSSYYPEFYEDPIDLNDSTFMVATDRYEIYDHSWNLIDDSKKNTKFHPLSNKDIAYVPSKTGFFALWTFANFYPEGNKIGNMFWSYNKDIDIISTKNIIINYDRFMWPEYINIPRGGLYKTDDGMYSYILSYDQERCKCNEDTLRSFLTRMTFDEDFNVVCHKTFTYPGYRIRLGYITDAEDGRMLLTGIADSITYPVNTDLAYHPFFTYIPKNGCEIPWAKEIKEITLSVTNAPAFEGSISCYPNPAESEITFETDFFPPNRTLQIILFDIDGKQVKAEVWNGSKTTINLAGFAPGIYLYLITDEKGGFTSGKFVKPVK